MRFPCARRSSPAPFEAGAVGEAAGAAVASTVGPGVAVAGPAGWTVDVAPGGFVAAVGCAVGLAVARAGVGVGTAPGFALAISSTYAASAAKCPSGRSEAWKAGMPLGPKRALSSMSL